MKFSLISSFIFLAGAAFAAPTGNIDFSKGVLFLNEDWYGHQNSTLNYLLPDAPEGECWQYRVFQQVNPGCELGCTSQYGAVWNGRLYIISKQEKDPGASISGGRISVIDADDMTVVKQIPEIDPSGRQCDGRAFLGVSNSKGYVSSSNGIWILDLNTLTVTGQVEGSSNPNVGDDKPSSDPASSLYRGQTGTMVAAAGRVFAVHQQYGILVIDPAQDAVVEILDMDIVDDAVEEDTGKRPSASSGIGSTLVKAKDGSIWYSASKNVQGSGSTLPYVIRLDPQTLKRDVVRIEGEGVLPPSNSWYAWTPDPFCASSITDCLYWCGSSGRFSQRGKIFRFDTASGELSVLADLSQQPDSWQLYGCSLGIDPRNDEIYCSLYHQNSDPTYITRRMDSDGNIIRDYPMISNYWFPSMPIFPATGQTGIEEIPDWWSADDQDVSAAGQYGEITVYGLSGNIVFSGASSEFNSRICPDLKPGLYIIRESHSGSSRKIIIP